MAFLGVATLNPLFVAIYSPNLNTELKTLVLCEKFLDAIINLA